MTAVLTVFGAAAFSLQFPNLILDITLLKFHAGAAIILFGLGLLLSMLVLDYCYYFKLLLGAVDRGGGIEKILQSRSSNQLGGLTIAIGKTVERKCAQRLLFWFYFIPLVLGSVFLVFVLIGYPTPAADANTKAAAGVGKPPTPAVAA